ncbi:MAG: hypothetical protein ABII64_08020 [Elusimicrobiota bacterium]
MSAIFDFIRKKWDRNFSELEKSVRPLQAPRGSAITAPAGGSAAPLGGMKPAQAAEGASPAETEIRYLSDIIRQNISEIKELHFRMAGQVVDIENLKRKLEESGERKSKRDKSLKNGRMRVLYALKRLRYRLGDHKKENLDAKRLFRLEIKKGMLLKDENEFLKTEVNSYMAQMKHYIEHIKELERAVTAKEEQLSKLFVKLKNIETLNESLIREVDRSNLEKRMMMVRHEIRKREEKHTLKKSLRKWLSTPLVDMKI